MRSFSILITCLLTGSLVSAQKAEADRPKPEETEFYSPVPPVITPGSYSYSTAPSDAIVLFDGKNLDQWTSAGDASKPVEWVLGDSAMTVNKKNQL